MSEIVQPPEHISNSQVSMILECPRKWAWYYMGNKERKSSKAQDIGKRFHHFIETGEIIPGGFEEHFEKMAESYHDEMFRSGLDPAKVKHEVKYSDGKFTAYLDGLYQEDDGWWIMEFKTAAKFNAAKTATLYMDMQINAYVEESVEHFSRTMTGDFKGVIYVQIFKPLSKKNPQYKTSIDFVRKDSIDTSQWIKQKEFAILMKDIIVKYANRRGDILDVPGCLHQCHGIYGTCEHFSHCHGGSDDSFGSSGESED